MRLRFVLRFSLAAALAAGLGSGCEPSCKATCKKLVQCEDVETPRVSKEECTASCEIQQQLYDQWTDTQKRGNFGDLKRCIKQSECADIADGVCYDEDLYIW
jgi:hypothetical protein